MSSQRLLLLALVLGLIGLALRKGHGVPARPDPDGTPAAAVRDSGR